MAKAERVAIIENLQRERGNTHLISYITSTRANLEVEMAMDAVRIIYDHLILINKPKAEVQIDLFLHSNGGDGTVPWRLVNLIREFASKLNVLVPYKAFSAATLTALGAHSIVMHSMGMLGPTDPTVANRFNPTDPNNPNQYLGISVEDVTAYIALIKEDAGIHHEDELVQAFNKLAENVHPLALGNVKRSLSQSRMMARKLLALHMDNTSDAHKIDEIVDSLTSKLYYHGHPINRREALEQVGLRTVEIASPEVEKLMWQLYLEYETEIKMEQPFQPALEFTAGFGGKVAAGGSLGPQGTSKLAFIESVGRTDYLSQDYQLLGRPNPDGAGVLVNQILRRHGWQTE